MAGTAVTSVTAIRLAISPIVFPSNFHDFVAGKKTAITTVIEITD